MIMSEESELSEEDDLGMDLAREGGTIGGIWISEGGIWISEGIGIWGLMMTGLSVRLEKDVTGEMNYSSGLGSGEMGCFLVLMTFLVFTMVVVALFALAGAVVIRVVVISKKKKSGSDQRSQHSRLKGQCSGGFDKEKEKTGCLSTVSIIVYIDEPWLTLGYAHTFV